MPTRGNPGSVPRAIRGFQLQRWIKRELLIVTSQPSVVLDLVVVADSSIQPTPFHRGSPLTIKAI